MLEPTKAVEAAIREDGQTIANATLKRAGNDTINGGLGDDHISGQDGNDTITTTGAAQGDAGDDVISGSGTLSGGDDNDSISGSGQWPRPSSRRAPQPHGFAER